MTKNIQSLQSLKSTLKFLNCVPAINTGGCGISALAIYRWCRANDICVSDRPFTFVWRNGNEWESSNNDELLENGELDLVEVPNHIVIELYKGLYDSNGQQNDNCHPFIVHQEYKLNEKELLAVINRPNGGWNSSFRRARQIPEIENKLNIDLSDVLR